MVTLAMISSGLKRMNSNESNSSMDSSRLKHNLNENENATEVGGHNSDQKPLLSFESETDAVQNGKVTGLATGPIKKPLSRTQSTPNEISSLFTVRAMIYITLWYFFSFTTLFLNKYIISYEKGDATMLGCFQLLMCAVCGYLHMRFPIGMPKASEKARKSSEKQHLRFSFSRNVIAVGSLRFSTIVLGLIALWYAPVSFAETIKSSAPVFTVFIARVLLGEKTTFVVNLSLIPVMSGLALCSAYELSFTLAGFIASLATNLSECLQNVSSKKLLSVERYSAHHLQFYTSVSSILLQIPIVFILVNLGDFVDSLFTEKNLLFSYILAGLSFHCQSLTEYLLLSLISPVTHSVANTVKRALLIWLSVLIFGNPVTFLSWLGTAIVIIGVLMYNKARQIDARRAPVANNYSRLAENTHDV